MIFEPLALRLCFHTISNYHWVFRRTAKNLSTQAFPVAMVLILLQRLLFIYLDSWLMVHFTRVVE